MLASPHLRQSHSIATLVPHRDHADIVDIERSQPIDNQASSSWIDRETQAGASGACSQTGDGRMIGYILYRQCHTSGALVIRRIAVHPDYQRRGVGRKLVDRACHRAGTVAIDNTGRKSSRVVAVVDETQVEALRFFRAYGSKSRLVRAKDGGSDRIVFDLVPTTAKTLAGTAYPL